MEKVLTPVEAREVGAETTRPGPVVYRLCRCGRMHATVPCEEEAAREEQRAEFRARLEAEKKPRMKADR